MATLSGFLPTSDSKFLEWSTAFSQKISATPAVYFLLPVQAAAYATLHGSFATALSEATDPATRTKAKVANKDVIRKNLKEMASSYGRMVSANLQVSDELKIGLGLNVRRHPESRPAPDEAPALTVKNVNGRNVKVKLARLDGKKGRPVGVQGASVFSAVGPTPPDNVADYKFEGNTASVDFSVQFSQTVPAGSKVWLTAFWFNPRLESGPACTPVAAFLQYGTVAMAA